MIRKNWGILLICLFFSIVYSVLSVVHHTHFLSGGFDLGIFDQALWQYAHWQFPYNTIKEKIILGDHLNLTLPLLSPLYWIWDDVKILLIFQSVWVSFSALAIYKYLVKRSFNDLQAIILSVIYLLFYGMQYLVYFDFHTVAIGVGLLAWVLYFWETEKWKWFIPSVILLLLTQENMGVALFGLCIIWFFQKKKIKTVILLAVISVIYTAVAFYAIKLIALGDLQYVPQLPQTFNEFITRFFDTQDKRDVWFFSFSWFSFLPLFSPGAVMAVVLDLAQYFPTGDAFNHMWTPYLHHRAILAIFLLAGAADVLLFLKSKKINITLVVAAMFLITLFLQWHYHFALNKLLKADYFRSEIWMSDNEVIFSKIDKNSSVAAQQSLVPHLSHRNKIYLVYPRTHDFKNNICSQKTCWWLDFVGEPEYLVVDLHDNEWLTMTLADIKDFRSAVANMEKSGVIKLTYQSHETKIYRINYKNLKSVLN